jgi:hypothetical protein
MTMAMSLASAVQAMLGSEAGFFDLNEEDHDLLADHFENYLRRLAGHTPADAPPDAPP